MGRRYINKLYYYYYYYYYSINQQTKATLGHRYRNRKKKKSLHTDHVSILLTHDMNECHGHDTSKTDIKSFLTPTRPNLKMHLFFPLKRNNREISLDTNVSPCVPPTRKDCNAVVEAFKDGARGVYN